MTSETILYICIATLVSLGLALFMYGYKTKYNGKFKWLFGVLRFFTLFFILLLIINPKMTTDSYFTVKPKLPILVDNSNSISELGRDKEVLELVQKIQEDAGLIEAFDVSLFKFSNDISSLDSLSFSENNTNIARSLSSINELYQDETAPILLITDGNQTIGTDYQFLGNSLKNPVFPIAVGDSTKYTDLRIAQLNTNKYAFLKNQFPVEVILSYAGTGAVTSRFVVTRGGNTVYSKNVSFSDTKTSETLSFTLPASVVGFQKYTAQVVPIEGEKNTSNNSKYFAVEVIDQSTNVLVVSRIIHPDLGALKKAITSNEQRKFQIKKPSEALLLLNDSQLVILYQPDRTFAGVYTELDRLKKNSFTISGLETDWVFLNEAQSNFNKNATNQSEEITGDLNSNYGTFAIEDIGFSRMPPMRTLFGELEITVPHEIVLEQIVDGFSTETPLLATMELNGKRDAILDGEGLWRWRAESYVRNKNFEAFDNFMGKMVQYLASNKRRSRLEVSSESFYYNNNAIKISAQYFDKSFVFDPRVPLNITIVDAETQERKVYPMLLRNNFFEVDLSSLPAGNYKYTVAAKDQSVARSGNFAIIGYDAEKQFNSADVTKLRALATHTKGNLFTVNQYEALTSALLSDARFTAIQKSEQKTVPLIDWKYLLGLIALTLALEWFIRKYNGLI
jgi:hypothetical protein